MAHLVKNTPILGGKSAIAFLRELKKSGARKVDEKTKAKILEDYQKMMAIAKF